MDPKTTRAYLSILAVRAIRENIHLPHYIDDEGWIDTSRLVGDVLVEIDGGVALSAAAETIVEGACRAYLEKLGFYTRERE